MSILMILQIFLIYLIIIYPSFRKALIKVRQRYY